MPTLRPHYHLALPSFRHLQSPQPRKGVFIRDSAFYILATINAPGGERGIPRFVHIDLDRV